MIALDLAPTYQLLDSFDPLLRCGRVHRVVGLSVAASGPAVPVGRVCRITGPGHQPCQALAVGFRSGELLLQPLAGTAGITSGDAVEDLGHALEIPVGPGLIGRVIDGLGRPLDDLGPLPGKGRRAVNGLPPPALGRRPIQHILETGQKAIDALFTLGKGQRLGIFAGAGLGKSTLLGEIARHARADLAVIGLIGERGREVGEFVHKVLGKEGLARSVVIAATSDRPAVERVTAALAAHAVAEHFRDTGLDVLLMVDSLTRLCQAQREIGLSSGEPPTVRGFPPSSFALLPGLLERAGTAETGTITALYTVLMEADEEVDPVADTVKAILDGHLLLSRRLAERAIFPAIDPSASISRLMVDLVSPAEWELALAARERWGEYERVRDLVEIGAYQAGADPRVDAAIACQPRLVEFIRQGLGQPQRRADSLAALAATLQPPAPAASKAAAPARPGPTRPGGR